MYSVNGGGSSSGLKAVHNPRFISASYTGTGRLNTCRSIVYLLPLFVLSRDSIWSSHAADDCILIAFWHVDSTAAKTGNRNVLVAEK